MAKVKGKKREAKGTKMKKEAYRSENRVVVGREGKMGKPLPLKGYCKGSLYSLRISSSHERKQASNTAYHIIRNIGSERMKKSLNQPSWAGWQFTIMPKDSREERFWKLELTMLKTNQVVHLF